MREAGQHMLGSFIELGDENVTFRIVFALKGNVALPAIDLIREIINQIVKGGEAEWIDEILWECGNEATMHLVDLVSHDSLDIQKFAVDALQYVGDELCIPCLVSCLSHSSIDIRHAAAHGLSRLKYKPLISTFVSLLQDEQRRWIAVRCLGLIGDPSVEEVLLELLPTADSSGAIIILETLGKLGSSSAIPAILPYLDHEDEHVQCVAANALSFLRHPEALKFLMERIEKGDNDYGESVDSGLRFLGKEAVPALLEYLASTPNRYAALVLLGDLGDSRAVPLLESLLWYDASYLDDSDLVFALMKHNGDAFAKRMIQKMVQTCAATSLGKIKDKSSVPLLIRKLSELSDAREYSCVVSALEEIGDPHAFEPILSKFLEKPEDIDEAMLSALGFFGKHFGAELLTLLEDSRELVRFVGVLAVTRAGLTEAAGKLRELEENEAESERVRFASQLARASMASAL